MYKFQQTDNEVFNIVRFVDRQIYGVMGLCQKCQRIWKVHITSPWMEFTTHQLVQMMHQDHGMVLLSLLKNGYTTSSTNDGCESY